MSIAIMLNGGLSLRRALKIVNMSRGSYYYKPKFGRSDGRKFRYPTVLDRIRGLAPMKPRALGSSCSTYFASWGVLCRG